MNNLKLQRVIANILLCVLVFVSIVVSSIFSEKFNNIWAGGLLLVMSIVIIYLFYRVNNREKKMNVNKTAWKELSTKNKIERILVGIIGTIIVIGFFLLSKLIVGPFMFNKLNLNPWVVLIILVSGFILYYRYNEAKMKMQKTSQAKHE